MKILISLQKDRNKPGKLTVYDAPLGAGRTSPCSCACLGKSDNAAAAAHGNPARNPLLPFGDIPTGTYAGVWSVPLIPARSYGPNPVLVLNPVSGDALTAKNNGRFGLLIHGGDLNAAGKFRPTHGCVRVGNDDMAWLAGLGGEREGEGDGEINCLHYR